MTLAFEVEATIAEQAGAEYQVMKKWLAVDVLAHLVNPGFPHNPDELLTIDGNETQYFLGRKIVANQAALFASTVVDGKMTQTSSYKPFAIELSRSTEIFSNTAKNITVFGLDALPPFEAQLNNILDTLNAGVALMPDWLKGGIK